MAGGIGSRFWPFSREEKPKQFLDFFGTGKSLLQMTVDRFRPIVPIENMFIVTNVAYKQIIMEQIPDLATRLRVLLMRQHISVRCVCRKPINGRRTNVRCTKDIRKKVA